MKVPGITFILLFILLSFYCNAQNWKVIPTGTKQNLNNLFFIHPDTGWVSGWGQVILSTQDGGENIKHGTTQITYTALSLYFHNENRGFFVASRGTIMQTLNGGEEWVSANKSNLTAVYYYDIKFSDKKTGWVVGGYPDTYMGTEHEAYLLKSTDSGNSWQSILNKPIKQVLQSIHFADQKTAWISGTGGLILNTTDGGNTWNTQNTGTNYSLNQIKFYNKNTGWVVGKNATILYTADGGSSWMPAYVNSSQNINSFDIIDSLNLIAVGDSGTYLRSTDGGKNWFSQKTGSSSNLSKIAIVGSGTAYITGWNGTLLKTTNLYVSAPQLTMTYPASGSTINNRDIEIKWNTNLSGMLELEYSTGNGVWNLIAKVPAQLKSYLWTVPKNISQFHVRIKDAENEGTASGTTTSIKLDEKINISFPGITIYPNPVTNGVLNIRNENSSIYSVEVFDCNGRKILFESFPDSPSLVKIDTEHLRQGLYIVYVLYPNLAYPNETKCKTFLFMKDK